MLLLTLSACGKKDKEENTRPLVVGYLAFSEKFSPFFATSKYDTDVARITGVNLFTTDRTGGIVFNAIEGETIPYNGVDYSYKGLSNISVNYDEEADITTYDIKIRDDVKFSDGHLLDADDIIFTYYVLSDIAYDGSSTFNSQPIVGMQNYRSNSTAAESITVNQVVDFLEEPNDSLKKAISDRIIRPTLEAEYKWIGGLYGTDKYKEEQEAYPVQKDLYKYFYGLDENYNTSSVSDDSQVVDDIIAQYGADYKTLGDKYAQAEDYFQDDAIAVARVALTEEKKAAGEGEDVHNIQGIKKISDTEVQVITNGYSATAVYQIGGAIITPLHYYGDEAQYDYENNKFGFPRGDLSIVKDVTTKPLGAGPYKFVKYENKVVFLEANEHYFKGTPKIKYVQLKETTEVDKLTGIQQGTLDITDPSGSKTVFEQIASINSNSKLSGDKIVTSSVDNLGYGYIGINAKTVNVGGELGSQASKNLRKALATVLSVYRDVANDTYYGQSVSVINYPISNTSWAAPQKSDSDYKLAFSEDIHNKSIYSDGMSSEDKYVAALQAALGFFEAAGYTVADGKLTVAPEGAAMEYEVIIPGNGDGSHPAFIILTDASAALATIGFNLKVNDITDNNILFDKLEAGTQELWCASWQAGVDPDMYQTYHSSNVIGSGGTDSNFYHIADAELDLLIMEARTSDDQSFRKSAYKLALDIIMDWAVEIPNYQRQNSAVFSTERVNIETITPDITTFYGWFSEIENLELK